MFNAAEWLYPYGQICSRILHSTSAKASRAVMLPRMAAWLPLEDDWNLPLELSKILSPSKSKISGNSQVDTSWSLIALTSMHAGQQKRLEI